jgi:hypothetical protein
MNIKLAVLAGLLFPVSAALANDAKIYPGSACTPVVPGQSYSLAFQSFTNTASTYQWVFCPVIRDNLDGKSLLANTYVTVYDNDPAGGLGDVYCSLRMVDMTGSAFALTYAYSPTGSTGTAQLTLGPLSTTVASTYYIVCRLPAAAGANQPRIISYYVDEPN